MGTDKNEAGHPQFKNEHSVHSVHVQVSAWQCRALVDAVVLRARAEDIPGVIIKGKFRSLTTSQARSSTGAGERSFRSTVADKLVSTQASS
jgi:hypothetical protein